MGCNSNMVRRQMNSYGTITIPKDLRDELGISGTTMLRLEVRESNNIKEIILRKDDVLSEVLNKYSNLAEILSRISECPVAVVWNNVLLSMSVAHSTESFLGVSQHTVTNELQKVFKQMSVDVQGKLIDGTLSFLPNNMGSVKALYQIPNTGDDRGFFVLLQGTKQDSTNHITKSEFARRCNIILDVIKIALDLQ